MALSKMSIRLYVWLGSLVFATVAAVGFLVVLNFAVDRVTQNQLEQIIKQVSIQSKNISLENINDHAEPLSWLSGVPYIKQVLVFGKDAETLFYYKKANQDVTQRYTNQWRPTFTKKNYYSDADVIHTLRPINGTHEKVESIYLEVDKRLLQEGFQPFFLSGYLGLMIFFITMLMTVWFITNRYVLPVKSLMGAVLDTKNDQSFSYQESLDQIEQTVTDLKSDNQNLVEKNTQLERELNQQADENAEIVNRLTSQFENEKNTKMALINLSGHGLKTLIHKMINDIELLKVHMTGAQAHEKVSQLNDSTHDLLAIIERLQIYSKLSENELSVEPQQTDIYRLLRSVLESNIAKAEQREHTLTMSFQCYVREGMLDAHKLRHILNNLIDNAIKFSLPGNIDLRLVNFSDDNQELLSFSVSDPGPGIEKLDEKRIFEPFQQASINEQSMPVGLGLGLSISGQLITLMSGKYGLEVTENGNRFWFTIPIEVISRSSELPNEKTPLQKMSDEKDDNKILVVEDNEVNQSVVLNMLEKLNCKVDLVNNGKQAIEACRLKKYDMILMDYHMPGMSGIETTQQLRDGLELTAPIIALTADDDEQVKLDFYDVGANDILIKPVKFNILVDLLSKFLDVTQEKLPEALLNDAVDSNPVLNMRVVDDICAMAGEDGQQMVQQIFQVYIEHSPSLIDAIKQAYEKQDSEQLFKSAHALKSSSLNIGASAVAETAKQIEMMARQNNLDQIMVYIDKLDTHYAELTSFLNEKWRGI